MRSLIVIYSLLFSSIVVADNGLTPLGQQRIDALIYGDRGQRVEAVRELQPIFTQEMKNEVETALRLKIESMNKSMPQQLDEATIVLGGLVSDGLVLLMYEIAIPESQLTSSVKKELRSYLQEQMFNQACTDTGTLIALLSGMKYSRAYSTASGAKLFAVNVDLNSCINR